MQAVGKSYKSPSHLRAARAYYARHKEKLCAKSKKWYYENRDKCLARRRQWGIDNPERVKAHNAKAKVEQSALKCHLKNTYGLTIEQRDKLFAKNNGFCWICSKAVSECVDHDHDSGKVRGALCRKCNAGLGLFKDSHEILLSAALYLKTGRTF